MTPDEKDWKLFRSKIALWQENYINKLNKEYAAILCGDESPSEKFWHLENKINADKKSRGVQTHLRRSTMLEDIISLLNDEVITYDDLIDFSGDMKEKIKFVFTDR
ncbi:MAG: multidrug transporter [Acutalibacteraceae bacterium]